MTILDDYLVNMLKQIEEIPLIVREGNGLFFEKKFVFTTLPDKTLNFAVSSIRRMTMVEKNVNRTVKQFIIRSMFEKIIRK